MTINHTITARKGHPRFQAKKIDSTPTNLFTRMTPGQQTSLLLTANIAVPLIKTWVTGIFFKSEGFNKEECRLQNTQELVRQTLNTVVWLVSSSASFGFISKRFPRVNPGVNLMLSNLIASIPDMTIRPFLVAKITRMILKGKKPVSSSPVNQTNRQTPVNTLFQQKPEAQGTQFPPASLPSPIRGFSGQIPYYPPGIYPTPLVQYQGFPQTGLVGYRIA